MSLTPCSRQPLGDIRCPPGLGSLVDRARGERRLHARTPLIPNPTAEIVNEIPPPTFSGPRYIINLEQCEDPSDVPHEVIGVIRKFVLVVPMPLTIPPRVNPLLGFEEILDYQARNLHTTAQMPWHDVV